MTEHIQINAVAPRIAYVADGVQSAFTYPFAIFRTEDIEVWLDDTVMSAGFSVSGAGITGGGAVLFAVPPAAGQRVTLRRRLGLARTADYQADGLIRAKTLNDEFDYQVAALQQVADEVERSVRRSPTSASLADLTLPEPAANRGLKWNAAGTALVNTGSDPDLSGDAIAAAAAAQAAAQAAAAAAQAATAATQAAAAQATIARDQAQAAVGGVRVSADDALAAPLATKVVAGSGIVLAELDGGGDERLMISSTVTVPAAIFDRLNFLEANLALNTLRDQIDAGWSVLKMVDGIADEFEDISGVSALGGATYDATGDYLHNPGGQSGNVATLGTASASSNFANWDATAAKANDGALPTDNWGVWASAGYGAGTVGEWWRLDFGGTSRALTKWGTYVPGSVALYQCNQSVIEYSDDGANWTIAATWNKTRAGDAWYDIQWAAVGSHRYWRERVTIEPSPASAGYNVAIGEVHCYETLTPANVTIVSTAATAVAGTTDNEARLVLLHQPIGAVTLNTDCTIAVSRDGGASWTTGALVNEGAFDATTNILSATISLTGQPAGTAMKWRFTSHNSTEQRLHGVWLQWR